MAGGFRLLTSPFKASGSRVAVLKAADHFLKSSGVEDARHHAELLLGKVLGLERARIYLDGESVVPEAHAREFEAMIMRRSAGEPTQYIVGETEFYGLPFLCDRRALIPRPETELLVERALSLAHAAPGRPLSMCDLGTGSGCIPIAVAVNAPELSILACDLSLEALQLARLNALRHAVVARIQFRVSDLFSAVPESFDLITANLPYVRSVDRPTLQREVRDWEPAAALFAGADGLEVLEPAILQAADHLRPGGHLLLEIGVGQLEAVTGLLQATSRFSKITHRADLQGHPRLVEAELGSDSN